MITNFGEQRPFAEG